MIPLDDKSSNVADVVDRYLSAIFRTSTFRYVHNTVLSRQQNTLVINHRRTL